MHGGRRWRIDRRSWSGIHGTFEITTAGTIIPSIALDVAAAAVVNAGSYFECIYLGPAAALGGSWS